eukprot:403372861
MQRSGGKFGKSTLSKQISKIKTQKANDKTKKMGKAAAGAGGKNKNSSKIGEATAKKMMNKVNERKEKRRSKTMEEEIDSDIADDIDMQEEGDDKQFKNAGGALSSDPFFAQSTEDQNETVEERKMRMTKQLLQELQAPDAQQNDFFETLQTKGEAEAQIFDKDDDILTRRLKYQILEKKGKLFYNIANDFAGEGAGEFERTFLKGHKKAITALEWSSDNRSLFTASKDCNLIQWDLESQKKLFFKGDKHNRAIQGHYDEPLCLAVSPNGKYLVSGGKDRIVRVWDIHNQQQIQTFMGHRDSITSIKFDRENDQFYTVSNDRSLKVWNIREMAYMDSHYGHQSDILGMDSYSTDRLLSCGLDRQVIFWKINEDSELLYKNEKHTVDTINVINSQYFVTGSSDNCLDLWVMNKKKPIFTLEKPHQDDSWVLSTANVRNSDLLCSGSYDGQLVFYKFNKEEKKLEVIRRETGLEGCLNNLKFSNVRGNQFNQTMLAVTHSKDERLGRWHVQPKIKDGITILRKTQ